jgi:hypothetical protein
MNIGISEEFCDRDCFGVFLMSLFIELLCDEVGPVHVVVEREGRVAKVTSMDEHFSYHLLIARS